MILASLGMLLCALAFGSTPALAGRGFAVTSVGGLYYSDPNGVAVDNSSDASRGSLYVTNQQIYDLAKLYGAHGETSVESSRFTFKQLTVDDYANANEGDVYVTGYGTGAVYIFNSELELIGELSGGLERPIGVAVDEKGDVFVADHEGDVREFNSSGEPVNTANIADADNVVSEGLREQNGIAVNAPGTDLYVATAEGTIEYTLADGAFKENAEPFESAGANAVTVAPSGKVFVAQEGAIDEYEPNGGAPLITIGAGYLLGSNAVAVSAETGDIYVADIHYNGVFRFEEGVTPESPVTGAVSEVGATTATLSGELKPNKAKVKSYFAYASGSKCTGTGELRTPELEEENEVRAELTELQPNATYTACLVAVNEYGDTVGDPQTFTTPGYRPVVAEAGVSGLFTNAAILGAQINPENEEAQYSLEYSTSETDESLNPPITKVAGKSSLPGAFGAQAVSVNTGPVLAPGTTYYYRFSAENKTSKEEGKPVLSPVGSFVTAVGQEAPLTEAGEARGGSVAVLKGELNPNGGAGRVAYRFAYNAGSNCMGGAETAVAKVAESSQAHVEVEVSDLAPGAHYSYCLIAASVASGVQAMGNAVQFQAAAAAPEIGGLSVSNIGPTGAVVHGQIDPGASPIESFYVEYGPSTAYGSVTEPQGLGAVLPLTVTAQLSGLLENTEYHFRLVASSADGETAHGADVAFRTRSAGSPGLPDGRAYEMVSPPRDDEGDVFVPEAFAPSQLSGSEGIQTRLPFEASVDGNEVAYVGEADGVGSGRDGEGAGDEFLATRGPEGGWSQASIQPPGVVASYQAFSSDLSLGVVESAENGSGETHGPLYLRDTATGSFTALSSASNSVYAGASANGSYLFMDASGLYDSVQGKASAVNVLPGGAVEGEATFGAPALRDAESNPPDFSAVISENGSRVFWSGLKSGGLYVRENPGQPQSPISGGHCTEPADACTVQIDAAVPGAEGSSGGGRFWTASSDGSKVFFTDESRLAVGSTAAPGKPDLYEYQVGGETGKAGTLTDLTAHAGEPADVQGVLGASEDGSYVYFVAAGALAEGAEPQSCEALPELGEMTGGCNLYVLHEGTLKFIAKLSSQDGVRVQPTAGDKSADGEFGDWQPGLGHRTAEVTPDGKALVFTSNESLTGYGNIGLDGGEPHRLDEVFLYQAENAGGRLSCVSCSPSGEAPSEYGGGAGGFLPVSWSDTYLPRWLSDSDGRVFFDSAEPLVPRDTNGVQDVYEWESESTGSCQAAAGCEYLISEGLNSYASWLLGASDSGNDVFVATRSELLQEGQAETDAVYDARVGGAPPSPGTGCPATGCPGIPVAPPVFATPASSTFNGVGNFTEPAPSSAVESKSTVKSLTRAQKLLRALRVCAKKRGAARRSCEAKAHKRYSGKAKKATRSTRMKAKPGRHRVKEPAKGRDRHV